jgi:putative ABC transport system permease protein
MSPFKRRSDEDFRQEIEAHLALETERRIADGLSPDDARHAAARSFGNVTAARERYYDAGRILWLDDLRRDMRYALRTFGRAPGFAAVAILTLTVGIGANTAIFSLVNAVLLRPLPYRDPGSLVLIEPSPLMVTPPWATRAWRQGATGLSEFAGFNGPRAGTLVVGAESDQTDVAEVTWNFLSFLGTPPALGRDFSEGDVTSGPPGVAILSHSFWSRRFGNDRGVLGTAVRLSGDSVTIIGVTGPEFRFPTSGALPASALRTDTQPDVLRIAGPRRPLNVIGRLGSGRTAASTSAELLAIFKQEAASQFSPSFIDRLTLSVSPLQERLVGDVGQRLWLIMGAVAFVLLVACANVANLLLARASARQRELAVRTALGAGQARLARQLLSESILLALAGAAGALLLTHWMRGIARTMLADSIPHVETIAIDWWVLGFSIAVALLTGVLCGLASLPGATRINLGTVFGGGIAPGVTGRTGVRRALLSTEVAVTFVLVVGAALMVQTLWNLHRKERGFDAERLLTMRVAPGLPQGIDRSQRAQGLTYFAGFFADLTQRAERLPGVASAAAVSNVPLAGASLGISRLSVDGQPFARSEDGGTSVASITPGYFRTMRTRIVAGRDFDDSDRMGAATVAIVNEAFQRRFAAGRDIVGARISYDKNALTVVGVVEDVPERSLRDPAQPLLFTPLAQMPAGPFGWGQLTLVLRTQGADPRALAPAVRREVWTIDRNIVVDELTSMDERVAASIRAERQSAVLFGGFALAALLIATIGVYGVATYAMAQRTKEIGIRMALGAGRRDFLRLVVSQTFGPTLWGIGVGAIGAFAATRIVSARLYGVTTLDPASFVGAVLVLTCAAFAASYLPARRATRIDPLAALRSE